MGLIRRNKSVPVVVQRPESAGPPEMVEIPGAARNAPGAVGGGAGQPNLTQNNIYISATGPPDSVVSPPPSPAEVHHHHTTVQRITRVLEPRKSLSFFGVVGLVLGALACAALYEHVAGAFVMPLALAGLVCAAFGLLLAILFRHAGQGAPFLGLLVSALALGWAFIANGGKFHAQITTSSDGQSKTISIGSSDGKLGAAIETAANGKTQRDQYEVDGQKLRSAVDQVAGKVQSEIPKVDLNAPAGNAPSNPAVVAKPTPAAVPMDLASAREAAAKRMGLDYQGAKAAAKAASDELDRVRPTEAPGTPVLLAAEQKKLDADGKLNEIESKLRSDPTVAAAEKAVKNPQQ